MPVHSVGQVTQNYAQECRQGECMAQSLHSRGTEEGEESVSVRQNESVCLECRISEK